MPDSTIANTLSLMPHQLVSITLKRNGVMRVMSGRVWVTIESDERDYWLSAGESLAVVRGRHVVIEAGATSSAIDLFHSCCAVALST